MQQTRKNFKGITLIEVVIYLALFGMFFLVMVQFFFFLGDSNQLSGESMKVDRAIIFLSQHFEDSFQNSEQIVTANTSFDVNIGQLAISESGGGGVGGNQFINPDFDTNTSSWAGTDTNVSDGWVIAPGNPTYGTDDFLVMQYEAKYDCTGDGVGDLAATCGAYADSGEGLDYRDISSFNPNNVVSTPQGAPIVHISNTQALSACPAGFDLITNDQWMTLARNIEGQSANWANGVIGSTIDSGGGLKRGNIGGNDSTSYDGSNPEQGVGRNSKAKHVLGNGGEIWDLSGNVWEHVAFDANNNGVYGEIPGDYISQQDHPEARNSGGTIFTGLTWAGFTSADTESQWYLQNNGSGEWGYDDFRPSNSSYMSLHGVGRIYHYSNNNTTDKLVTALRGGYWMYPTEMGLFSTALNNFAGNQFNYSGFRCASSSTGITQSYGPSIGRSSTGGNEVTASPLADGLIYQQINVGNSNDHELSVYVYNNTSGSVGGTVNNTVAQLYYNGGAISTDFEDVGSGWWKLSATVSGADQLRQYGLLVVKEKTVNVDDFNLADLSPPIDPGTFSTYMVSDGVLFLDGTAISRNDLNISKFLLESILDNEDNLIGVKVTISISSKQDETIKKEFSNNYLLNI